MLNTFKTAVYSDFVVYKKQIQEMILDNSVLGFL